MSASTRNKHSKFHNDEKVDISKAEFDRITEAFKKEEFRKLFFDYVEEIQDPANRKIYEEEITQLEKERGVEVTFIHPKPGFVVKTSIDGTLKCFINIAGSVEIDRPHNEVSINPNTGERGLNWSIPMAQTPSREDLDAQGKLCKVFDVVFHPDALHLGKKNAQFRQCLLDTALDGVEREYKVRLDRTNLKFPKLDYKGVARPTVIRTLSKHATSDEKEPHPFEHMYPDKPDENAGKPKVLPVKTKRTPVPTFTVPKYSIKHSHDLDMSEYTDELDAKLQSTVPRSLIVEIELPQLSSTADCELDVTEKSVYLLSERPGAKYRLKLDLPYAVDDKAGNARFDTDKRRLSITLPVVRSTAREEREKHDTLRLLSREDSGVELNSNSESPAEDEPEAEANDAIVELTEQVSAEDSNAFPPTVDISPRSFLKNHLHYQLPANFDCNVLDNVLAFVLHVSNVQPDSIQTLQHERRVHLQFASMGTGYYPTYYAFLVELPESESPLNIEQIEADASDDNVVLRLHMNEHCETLPSYLAGTDSNDLKQYSVRGQYNENEEDDAQEQAEEEQQQKQALQISSKHDEVEQALEVTIVPQVNIEAEIPQQQQQPQEQTEQQKEQHDQHEHAKKPNKKQRKRNKRSLSESACEDIKAAQLHENQQEKQKQEQLQQKPQVTLNVPQRKQRSFSECNEGSSLSGSVHRGILKRFSRYGPRPSISDSCSSIDDCSSSYSCSVDGVGFSQSFGGIPEERVADDSNLSESCKKTVRFNDHIIKQTFRLDSSILGQRKKNQKRRDCKLRAQQRRVSEGDSADYDEMDHNGGDGNGHKTATNAQYFKQHNNNSNKNKKHSFHDSGLDLTGSGTTSTNTNSNKSNNNNSNYNEGQTKRSEADAKNSMIFEMDDDEDEM